MDRAFPLFPLLFMYDVIVVATDLKHDNCGPFVPTVGNPGLRVWQVAYCDRTNCLYAN